MTAPTALGACRKCAKAAPLGASFCPSCGSPVGDIAVIQLEPVGARHAHALDNAEPPPVTGWGVKALLVGGCCLLVALLLVTRSPSERSAPATPTTQPTTTTTTQLVAEPATTSPATETTLAPFVGLPPLEGYLVALGAHGDLLQIDLDTGVATSMAFAESGTYSRFHLLNNGVLLQGDERLELITPSGEQRPFGSGWVIATTPELALVASSGPSQTIELRDNSGTVVATPNAEAAVWVGLTSQGAVAVQRGQRIGIVDGKTGAFGHLADGVAFYAAGNALVRLSCETISRCEVRSGPFDDPDRWRISADAVPRGAELTSSPSGRYLVASDWNTGERILVDLASGGIRQLESLNDGMPGSSVSFSADERWLASISSADRTELTLTSLDDEAVHTLPLAHGRLVAVAFTPKPVIASS